MPLSIGGGRAYPTENQPLSYAQQYAQGTAPGMPAAAAPPTNLTPFAYGGGSPSGATGMATMPPPTPYVAGQTPWGGNMTAQPGQTLQPGYASPPPSALPSQPGANIIGGQLPWNGAGGSMFQGLSGDPATTLANLGSNYQNAYNAALGMNQSNYNNILAGYQQTAANQTAGQQGVIGGYNQLSHDVLGGISNIGSDQLALINRNYTGQAGQADQNLINSGLGNSTVRSSVQRGIGLDQSLAQNNLANSIAQTKAGYQSNIGLSGLNYQGNAVNANTGLATHQLDWMNSVNAGYPNAALYGTLAQQAGAAIQSNANRAQIDRLAQQNTDLGAQVRQAAVLGGSGGTAAGTGGRLPPSAVNYSQGSGASPGVGSGGGFSFSSGPGSMGQQFGTSPPAFGSSAQGNFAPMPGYGGTPAGAGGVAATGSGFGAGLNYAPGVTNLMGAGTSGAVGGGYAAGAGFNAAGAGVSGGGGSAQDQYYQYASMFGQAAADAVYASMGIDTSQFGGGAGPGNPGGGDFAQGLGIVGGVLSGGFNQFNAYDAASGAVGGGYDGGNVSYNDGGDYYAGYGGDYYGGSVGAAYDTGAGAFGGLSDYYGGGGDSYDWGGF